VSGKIKTVNLESGMPTVAMAAKLLDFELTTARKQGVSVLKIIHGYGSSGTGGRLKSALRKIISEKHEKGAIRAFVPGDKWSIFGQNARSILEQCNELRNDSDLENYNNGITIILL
jgi:hypothetical protein